MTNNELTAYSVSWQVSVLLPALMEVKAPAGLDEDDPGLQDWENINPRAIDPRQRGRSKYYPNPIDPQQGVRVYESRN